MDLIPPVNVIEKEAYKSRFVVGLTIERELKDVQQSCVNAFNALQQEIKKLKSHLSFLETSCSGLELRITKLHAAVAPHRKLPPEILRYIFQLAHRGEKPMLLPREAFSPGETDLSDPHIFRPHHVCSFWREVAFTIPEISKSIWHSVNVNYNVFEDPERPEDYEGFREYYEETDNLYGYIQEMTVYGNKVLRRGARYLEVTFAIQAQDWVEEIPDVDLLIQLLDPAPSSLKILKISHSRASQEFQEILSSILPSLVGLKSLQLKLGSGCGENLFFPLPDPKLSSLVYLDLLNVGASVENATVLSVEDCYSLLTSCLYLKQCTLAIGCDHNGDISSTFNPRNPDNPITLARLETLRFFRMGCRHNTTKCDPATILQHLALPSLQTLGINASYPSHNGAKFFTDLLTRSQCRLTQLIVQKRITEEGQDPDWKTLITHFLEDLRTLSVPRNLIDPDILCMIANEQSLPNLERIECRVEAVEETCSAVESLLQARYAERHPGREAPKSLAKFMTR